MTALSLVLLVGLFSTAGAVMAYYFLKNPDILFAGKSQPIPTKTTNHLKIEDGELLVPGYLLAKVNRTALRKVTKINLTIPLNWTPEQPATAFNGSSDTSKWIFAAVEHLESRLSNRDWLTKIYRHYIAAPASRHASGLYRYDFKPESPYANIALFTDNLQNPTVLITCESQTSTLGTRLCSRKMSISPRLTVQYKFPRAQLAQWQKTHQTMQALLREIFTRKAG